MESDPPETLRLQMTGCGISGTRVSVVSPAPGVMYFDRGWKTFARIHSLTAGFTLHFKLMEADFLSVKVFGSSGSCLGCCAKSSTNDESSTSSDSDEEDSDGDDDAVD